MLPPGLPEYTLGDGVLAWGSANLAHPDRKKWGEQWTYTPEQVRFLLWWYAVDENGQWIYQRGVLERPKGWGKSPFLAAIVLTEMLGPVIFDHFDERAPGGCVGVPYTTCRIQVAASALDQTDYTFVNARRMLGEDLPDSKLPPVRANYPALTISHYKITAPGRLLEACASAANTQEGSPIDFAVLDETHKMLPNNKGIELWEAYDRNTIKRAEEGGGRYIEATNAPVPGEGSVAEITHDAYDAICSGASTEGEKILFDTREVYVKDIRADKQKTFEAWRIVYGDACNPEWGWINLERLWKKINTQGVKDHVARRYYFNQRLRMESRWMQDGEPTAWDSGFRPGLTFDPSTQPFALGFKGGHRSAAALAAHRLEDGAVFLLHSWERPQIGSPGYDPKWEVPHAEVDASVRGWLAKKNCYKLFAHPDEWQDIIGRWSIDFPEYRLNGKHVDRVEEFELSLHSPKKASYACEQFETGIRAGRYCHDGNEILTRHVQNSFMQETIYGSPERPGYVIRKVSRHSPLYICAAEAVVLATEAAVTAIEEGAVQKRGQYSVFAV